MAPTIDAELEQIDRKHAQLERLSGDLVEALNLYHSVSMSVVISVVFFIYYFENFIIVFMNALSLVILV